MGNGWEMAANYFSKIYNHKTEYEELLRTRKAQKELMEQFKDDPICSAFFAFEREYSVGNLGLSYIFGTAYDARDEDEDDDIRPY